MKNRSTQLSADYSVDVYIAISNILR